MDGVIQGGWEWVAAAWGISLGLLVAYAVTLEVRLRKTRPDDRHDRNEGD